MKSKFEDHKAEMKNTIREYEQEERHVQKTVDNARTAKTGIDSEINLKEKERKEVEQEIEDLRQQIKEVHLSIILSHSEFWMMIFVL